MIKKGQMEIFGLAIIMILLILGLLVFASFQKPREQVAENYLLLQIPSKTLQTMMHTTTNCLNQPVNVLISNVASKAVPAPSGMCGSLQSTTQVYCGGGKYAYDSLFDDSLDANGNYEGAIPQILESLDEAFIKYEFSISLENSAGSGSCYIYEPSNNCEGARRVDAETFILTSDQGEVSVNLRVC